MLTGLHHVTAIASDPQKNAHFYAKFLGLRLVKKTVNFDDPGTYHLYYGDQAGTPGSILTFFPWPGTFRGRKGNGQAVRTAYTVPALQPWLDKARAANVPVDGPQTRMGQEFITLTDPDGMLIELFADARSPKPEMLHSVTLGEKELDKTARLLTGIMGFRLAGEEGSRARFAAESGSGFIDIDVSEIARGTSGAGTVHHIAFRTPTGATQEEWRHKLLDAGYHVSPVMDRNYFTSIYFREPGGVLFEIATDPPGFTVDEPLEQLGLNLKLPRQYEPLRAKLEATLPAVTA